jgi:transposase-like protein
MGTSNAAVVEADSFRKALPATRRQCRSPELKRQIVEETLMPGGSVGRVARAHGVNANQVFASWRRPYRQGLLGAGNRRTPGLLAVRVVALGGKNCLFAASDRGGERAAALYSLIGTAKLNGLDPETYLREGLSRLAKHPINRIEDLLPWNLAVLASPVRQPAM